MSDKVQDAIKALEQTGEAEKRRRELQEKKVIIDSYRADADMKRIEQEKRDMQAMKSADFSQMGDAAIQRIRDDNQEYVEGAKNSRTFINDSFKGHVPFWPGNYIVVGARSGEGKSTAVANIAYSTIKNKNPATGALGKALVITNEEEPSSVYNRVTCIHKGWNYIGHENFSEEQVKTMDEMIHLWAKDRKLVVINDNFIDQNGVQHRGATTSLEGIQMIFDHIVDNKIHCDVIIIDYSQKISTSKKNPWKKNYEVQYELAYLIDNYKKKLPCPIVVMTQLMAPDKQNLQDFQERIRGSKEIYFPCTVALEMIPDRNNLRTKWTLHKNRWNTSVQGVTIVTGYDNGKFVPDDADFAAKATARILERENKAMSQSRLSGVFEKESK
jgi:replicative DNA helicase